MHFFLPLVIKELHQALFIGRTSTNVNESFRFNNFGENKYYRDSYKHFALDERKFPICMSFWFGFSWLLYKAKNLRTY